MEHTAASDGEDKADKRWGWPGAGWTFLGLAALALGAIVYLYGLTVGGLEVDETCGIGHQQSFDLEYRLDHPEHAGHYFFPLSDKCNADYDMVPIWLNPMVVGLGALSVWSIVKGSRIELQS